MTDKRTLESLSLLISYLSLLGVWFAIPSVSLLLNRDDRWPKAVTLLCTLVVVLLVAYTFQWRVLFPKTALEYEDDDIAN